jgi:hypothetical protein
LATINILTGIVAQLGSPQMLDFYDNSVLPGLRVKQLLNLILLVFMLIDEPPYITDDDICSGQ